MKPSKFLPRRTIFTEGHSPGSSARIPVTGSYVSDFGRETTRRSLAGTDPKVASVDLDRASVPTRLRNPDRYAAAMHKGPAWLFVFRLLIGGTAPVRAAGHNGLTCDPKCREVSLNVYIFFRLDVFLAVFLDAFTVFFDFFAFLAMFPSTQRKSNIRYACADYTINRKLIPRASKRVNGHPTPAACNRAKRFDYSSSTAFAGPKQNRRRVFATGNP
jgi:hypothetical protein